MKNKIKQPGNKEIIIAQARINVAMHNYRNILHSLDISHFFQLESGSVQ